MDSAMLLSGSLPISSAFTDSTTVSEFFFFAVELRNDARKPVTTIAFCAALWSELCAFAAVALGGGGGVAGCVAVAAVAAPVIAGWAVASSAASAGVAEIIIA